MSGPSPSIEAPSLWPAPPDAGAGSDATWPETDHSVLNRLRNGNPANREKALEQLFEAYSQPIRGYIRHHWPSLPHEDINDIFSEFATRCLTGDKAHFLTYEADRPGHHNVRLRTYLCKILNHFLVSHHRRTHALSRGGNQHFESLDTTRPAPHHELPDPDSANERAVSLNAYDRHWAQHILSLAFGTLESSSTIPKEVLAALKPWILADPGDATLKELATELGRTHAALRAQLYRLRKSWRQAIREAVAQTVSHPDDVDDELRHLAAVLSQQAGD